jgi:hypothetical protein
VFHYFLLLILVYLLFVIIAEGVTHLEPLFDDSIDQEVLTCQFVVSDHEPPSYQGAQHAEWEVLPKELLLFFDLFLDVIHLTLMEGTEPSTHGLGALVQ